ANIFSQLAWLSDSTTQHDLVILSLSGHGQIDRNEEFFFLPYDYDSKLELAASAISKQDILSYLRQVPCPAIVLIDACHSGKMAVGGFRDGNARDEMDRAVTQAIDEFSRAGSGIIVLAACLSREKATENRSW